jgi:hypothetical protein
MGGAIRAAQAIADRAAVKKSNVGATIVRADVMPLGGVTPVRRADALALIVAGARRVAITDAVCLAVVAGAVVAVPLPVAAAVERQAAGVAVVVVAERLAEVVAADNSYHPR